jgi:hypothetical protein
MRSAGVLRGIPLSPCVHPWRVWGHCCAANMSLPRPQKYSKGRINAAGYTLASVTANDPDRESALIVAEHWRSCHMLPMGVVETKRLMESLQMHL